MLICPALRAVVNIRWLVRVLAVIELVVSDDNVKKEPIRVLVEMVLNEASWPVSCVVVACVVERELVVRVVVLTTFAWTVFALRELV